MASGIFVILNVDNIDKSLEFYRGLGLKAKIESQEMGAMGTMRWVTVASGAEHTMMLFNRNFEGADPEDVAWASGNVGKGVLINVGVANAAKAHEAAKKLGAEVEDLTPNPWGGQSFNVADPDGYYLNLSDRFPPAPRSARKGAKAAKKGAAKSAKKGRRAPVRRRR